MERIFNTVHLSRPFVRPTQIKAADVSIPMIVGMTFTIVGMTYLPLAFMGLSEMPLSHLVIAFALIYWGHRSTIRKIAAKRMRDAVLPAPNYFKYGTHYSKSYYENYWKPHA